METKQLNRTALWLAAALLLGWGGSRLSAQSNNMFQATFQDLVQRYPVGDPGASNPIAWTEGPKTLAAADMNGDGRADVIAGNLDGSISVLLSRTNAWGLNAQLLMPATNLLRGASLRAVIAADLDGDGTIDIVAGDIAGKSVIVLFGNGDGTLREGSRIPVGPVRTMAVGDLNRDGKLDLVVGCGWSDCDRCSACSPANDRFLCVLTGRGDGTFEAPQLIFNFGIDACFYDLAVADINQDGLPDVLALDYSVNPTNNHRILIVTNDASGTFSQTEPSLILQTTGRGPRAMAVGYLDERYATPVAPEGATLDIVLSSRESRAVEIILNRGAMTFAAPVLVPVGDTPRDTAIGDLDGDGWADLVVVNRNLNAITVLRGQGEGQFLVPVSGAPAGTSPRQVVLADLDGDGALDAAVNNRISQDISIYKGRAGEPGFLMSENYYPSGFTPDAVLALDANGDGFPDMITANLRSHDVRVRLNLGDGAFGPETIYPVNHSPVGLASADLNGDGIPDLVVTCLGASPPTTPFEKPAMVVMLGRGNGTFELPVATPLGVEAARPYILRLGDLNGDGKTDAVVGTTDGALVVFKGLGGGSFEPGMLACLEPDGRPVGLALGDFDGDGRLDIACSRGDVFLNDDQFFATTNNFGTNGVWLGRIGKFNSGDQAWRVEAADIDGDGKLDLMVALTFARPDPIAVFYGDGAGGFGEWHLMEGPDIGAVAIHACDMDGDGIKDIVIANRCMASVEIIHGLGDRHFDLDNRRIILTPSVEDLAIADLNGDGKPDFLGVGGGVWPLINGQTNTLTSPRAMAVGGMGERAGLYINELMSQNQEFFMRSDVSPDWVEIYNHSASAQDLAGWSLLQITGDNQTNAFTFAPGESIEPWGHRVVFYSRNPAIPGLPGPQVLGKLSAEGETLALVSPEGTLADRVVFPALPADVSYARYADGARMFAFNSAPTLGAVNQQPGNLDPSVERKQPYVEPGTGRFALTARVFDDVVVSFLAVNYRVAGATAFTELNMCDDGAHGDKLPGDGYYGGFISGVPAGATLEFYFRAIDLEGSMVTSPKDPEAAATLYRIVVPGPGFPARLAELVADNRTGLRDEKGQYEDWVELWNPTSNWVSLAGVALSKDVFTRELEWPFPSGTALQPGGRLVVFCDEDGKQGPYHANFKLTRDADRVFLIQQQGSNLPVILDSLSFQNLPEDVAWGVLGQEIKAQLLLFPTPGQPNVPSPGLVSLIQSGAPSGNLAGARLWSYLAPGADNLILRWTGPTNALYEVRYSEDLQTWLPLVPGPRHLGSGYFGVKDLHSARYGAMFFRAVQVY